jgi:transcriptional regulator with XRE-family HTH domain
MPRSGLDAFLTANNISTSELARLSKLSRKHAITIRHGRGNPTQKTMRRIATACSKKLQREVTIAEAFRLSDVRKAS